MIKFKSNPIIFPTYESEVIAIVTDSLVEAAKELELPWDFTDDDYIDAYCLPVKDKVYIVYKDNIDFRTILHEPIHAINKIYHKIGAEIHTDNDETYVRDVCWLQEQIYNLVKNEIKH